MSETSEKAAPSQAQANPLLKAWQTPFETPPFAEIVPEHFLPAFEQAFADHAAEIAAITHDPATPDFANTITALERSGKLLSKVSAVFYDLVSAHSNPALLEIDKEVSLRMARHWNPIMMNAVLFGRIALLHDNRATLGLTPEQMRLLERTYTRFHRAGAGLDEAAKKRMAEINERLAHLGTAFSHHLLGDEQDWFMELGEADRDGLSDSFIAAARAAAERARHGRQGDHDAVALLRGAVPEELRPGATCARKSSRPSSRAATTATPTTTTRPSSRSSGCARRAPSCWAFPTFAAYRLEDSMAKTPEAVRGLLERVWKPARARALADRDDLQALVAEEGGNFALAPWDWRYYAEKLRQRRANFDDAAIKPYLALDHMIEAAFDCATRLFGVSFTERKDIPVWHPDVRVWEVKDSAGRHKALFYGDYFARPSKRSGAWMTSLRDQQKLDGEVAPLIINVCNFSKGADGQPSLLSPDDARTLFHEFGHGLARDAVGCDLSVAVRHQRVHGFRRTAFAALRALAGAAAGAAAVRPALPDRRAAAGRPVEALFGRAKIQPGLCHRGIRLLGADRPRIPHPAGLGQPGRAGVRAQGTGKDRDAARRFRCGTGRSSSAISFPAIIMRRAITATCGPR